MGKDKIMEHNTRVEQIKTYLERLSAGEELEKVRTDFVKEFEEVLSKHKSELNTLTKYKNICYTTYEKALRTDFLPVNADFHCFCAFMR